MQIIDRNIAPKLLGDMLMEIFKKERVVQLDIQNNTGVSQSQISRILNGNFSRVDGKNVKRICKYANISLSENDVPTSDPRKSEILIGALQEIWDGTHKKEKALAGLIRSLGPLINN